MTPTLFVTDSGHGHRNRPPFSLSERSAQREIDGSTWVSGANNPCLALRMSHEAPFRSAHPGIAQSRETIGLGTRQPDLMGVWNGGEI